MTKMISTTLLILLALYVAICLVMYFAQSRLIFPAWLAGGSGPLPPGAERLTLETPDGIRLEGVHFPPAGDPGSGTLILSFAGNATNAQYMAERLQIAFPEHAIAAFHYRGYAPSTGSAGAEAMAGDAPLAYDFVVNRIRPRRVVAVGVSLGSGIAARLAAERPLDGLILVTPFDSLKKVARQIYWWLPVSLLMRHDVDSVEALRDSDVPVAIVLAGQDRLVRPERTAALRLGLRNLRYEVSVSGAAHNDIFLHPRFDPALREALERVLE